jgi:hypothetical protein
MLTPSKTATLLVLQDCISVNSLGISSTKVGTGCPELSENMPSRQPFRQINVKMHDPFEIDYSICSCFKQRLLSGPASHSLKDRISVLCLTFLVPDKLYGTFLYHVSKDCDVEPLIHVQSVFVDTFNANAREASPCTP